MRLWIVSDPHMERRQYWPMPIRPVDFDVLVVAGDVCDGEIERSIAMVAAAAGGKPAVFVAGNHEWWHRPLETTLERGHEAAREHGVHFLECDGCEIGDVRFAGATLWTPDDVRFVPSVAALSTARPHVAVTHFEPTPALLSLVRAPLWLYGHAHGFSDLRIGGYRLVRNALGYPGEPPEGEPARPDFVIEV